MSKKNLLEESTIRKFMKFANLGHLAESFVDEAMYEDDMEADMLPPEAGEEFAGDEEEPMEEPAAEEGNEELLARVVQAVADELGVEAEVEGAGEEMGMEDEEMGMEDEEELEGLCAHRRRAAGRRRSNHGSYRRRCHRRRCHHRRSHETSY